MPNVADVWAEIGAGASVENADKAAEEMAGFDSRLAGIDIRLAVLTWMAGTNLALTAGVLLHLLAH